MLDTSNETIENYSRWNFYLYLHGQMMVNKSTHCFANDSVSQKKNQLLESIDQTIGILNLNSTIFIEQWANISHLRNTNGSLYM